MSKVTIEIDEGSGFCFGVVTAIRKAEEELARGGVLYCLGDIVHNSREVERLRRLGLVTIDHAELARLHDVKVLLRAHGEPPQTYELARRNRIDIIDATCPVVLRLQQKIRQRYAEQRAAGGQIVIYGKPGHAEVLGLVGQTEGQAIVVESLSEAERIDLRRPISLYSQTTKSLDEYRRLIAHIGSHVSPQAAFDYHDTICRQVASRIPNIRRFATAHSLVLFVSGRKSSNGKMLFAECQAVNRQSYLVEGSDDLSDINLHGARSIGICGATSTPKWLMEQVADRARELTDAAR